MFFTPIVQLWRHGGEWMFQVVEWLLANGATSSPVDGCECLYYKVSPYVTVVFELMARGY